MSETGTATTAAKTGGIRRAARAVGIGRPAAPFPPRRPSHRYLLGDHVSLSPWLSRFRFGWVLSVQGPFWSTGIGVVGPDWNNGQWLGGMSWKRRGPVAICRTRRRGSWRGDRQFKRAMAKIEAEKRTDDVDLGD